jgi:hypothetical protein
MPNRSPSSKNTNKIILFKTVASIKPRLLTEAFQALDPAFPVFRRFYEAHYIHDFNGFIFNTIPLLKKLQLREVAGASFLIAPERELPRVTGNYFPELNERSNGRLIR